MKILFIAYLENDAIVRCIKQLQAALLEQDAQSDLLTFRWNPKQLLKEQADCGMRYRVDTWYRHAQLQRDAEGKIALPWYGYLRVALARGFSMLVGGLAYHEQGFPFLAGTKLGRKVRTLCKQNHYDWVVSVSYPFMMHRLVKYYRPHQTHWAMYALDPFYHNVTYSRKREHARLCLECAVSKSADIIFHVPEQAEDYTCRELQPLRAKYHPLNYPNFVQQESTGTPSLLKTEPGYVNLVYLGTLYSDVRKPDALLELFGNMIAKCPTLRLHLIGNVFGVGAGETITRYKERLGDALQTYLPMPSDLAKAALQAADVLVNIGNTIHNQMPSKLWEYIASGKPILSVCMIRDCNTIPYLSTYPNSLCVFADEVDQEQNVINIVHFCINNKKPVISWSKLSSIYPQQSTDAIARYFKATLIRIDDTQ